MTTPIDYAHLRCGATAPHYHPKVGLVGYQMKALSARNLKRTSLLHAGPLDGHTHRPRPFNFKC